VNAIFYHPATDSKALSHAKIAQARLSHLDGILCRQAVCLQYFSQISADTNERNLLIPDILRSAMIFYFDLDYIWQAGPSRRAIAG
jgi:hypothetical protein